MTTSNPIRRARTLARAAAAQLRAWFDPPLESDAQPLEVREAIVDRIEQLAEPSRSGRFALPHTRIGVVVLAPDKESRQILHVALADLDAAIRTRLAEVRCPLPHGFTVDVSYARKPRAGWKAGERFALELDVRATARAVPASSAAPPPLRVTVVRGRASEETYLLSEPRVLVGRTHAPIDHTGRPRNNHVVFLDEADGHNASVGRAHASIQFEPERRQYRLFDEGSHNGTRIVRNGRTIDVAPRNPVGVALLSGDEVQFGTAAVRIDFED